MGPLIVVIVHVFTHEIIEMPQAEDDEVIEAFLADLVDPGFCVGIEIGRAVGGPVDFEVGAASRISLVCRLMKKRIKKRRGPFRVQTLW